MLTNLTLKSKITLELLKLKYYEQKNDYDKVNQIVSSFKDDETLVKSIILMNSTNDQLRETGATIFIENELQINPEDSYYNNCISKIYSLLFKEVIIKNNQNNPQLLQKAKLNPCSEIRVYARGLEIARIYIDSYIKEEEITISDDDKNIINEVLNNQLMSAHLTEDISGILKALSEQN